MGQLRVRGLLSCGLGGVRGLLRRGWRESEDSYEEGSEDSSDEEGDDSSDKDKEENETDEDEFKVEDADYATSSENEEE